MDLGGETYANGVDVKLRQLLEHMKQEEADQLLTQ